MYLKNPPRIKVLEALGAIADGRVKVINENECEVISSEGDRIYKVVVRGDFVNSDDNGTVYRNYVGYPIIACLMLLKKLSFNEKFSSVLRGIPWRKLNEEYKSYERVEEIVFEIARERNVNRGELENFIKVILDELRRLHLRKTQ
ncbi:hypothetical protein EWF20_03735 [Sulfolobus sp. S-194]|uniref:hypothetical protein n=1 Tax=Sulfolobus sp. S-194 TaxID=2512240 RepID=UPI001436D29D|nr:hypothetical protein [Sulfolobus sp. S-194]QIW23341.1 hypothetical protein EWF20_03735 [Sulfolobus sp. S-194]